MLGSDGLANTALSLPFPMSCDGGNSFQKSHLLPSSFQIIQLRDILRSNTFPQQAVASSLQRVTEESSLELARYNAEILRLEETLAKLRSDRNALELYSGECRSVFSPVRRLPIELLIEIFDLCSPPGSDIVSDTTTQTEELDRIAKKHLLHLSQV